MLELWLIRHGETDWNAQYRIQGQQHNALSERGVRQARRLGRRLAGEHFDTLYCSDLKRTVQTAELAFPERTFTFDKRLREISRGVLEGQLGSDLVGGQRDVYTRMQRDVLNIRPPGGENYRDLAARVVPWLESLPASGRVVAVTHGGVIYTLLHHVVGVAWAADWRFSADNTGITRLRIRAEMTRLISVNDTAHLEAWAEAGLEVEAGLEAELSPN